MDCVIEMKKKVTKLRGSKSHGYGSKKKHRGKGSRGGRGYAGSSKHRRSYILKYEKDHFYHKKLKPKKRPRTINISELLRFLKPGDKEIDLGTLGYGKLLGNGPAPSGVVVKVGRCTAKAREKIETAGGKVITTAKPREEQPKPAEKEEKTEGENKEEKSEAGETKGDRGEKSEADGKKGEAGKTEDEKE